MTRDIDQGKVWRSRVPPIRVDLHCCLECGRHLRMGELRKDANVVKGVVRGCPDDYNSGWQRFVSDTTSLALRTKVS